MQLADMNVSVSVKILDFYNNVDEDSSLLAYGTLSTGTQLLTFHRSLLPPSSGFNWSKKMVALEDWATGVLSL
jgi:hypothetical protein